MKTIATLSLAAALGALCTAQAYAGMNDERVQKRDEIWRTQPLEHGRYESRTPETRFNKEILPQRQNTKRVMG